MNNDNSQVMNYDERESLKRFAVRCAINSDIQSLERTLIMVAHWMRQDVRVSFSEYAGQWVEAQRKRTDGQQSTPAMSESWPFGGKKCMHPCGSDYLPYGLQNLKADDDTEIRHAINLINSQYPKAGVDGLISGSQELMESFQFITEVKSCLSWLRSHGLDMKQIKTFPVNNPSSYGFKHIVETHNQRNGEDWQNPGYIRNGAFIVAMVVCGYRLSETDGGINALFNISRSAVRKALEKN